MSSLWTSSALSALKRLLPACVTACIVGVQALDLQGQAVTATQYFVRDAANSGSTSDTLSIYSQGVPLDLDPSAAWVGWDGLLPQHALPLALLSGADQPGYGAGQFTLYAMPRLNLTGHFAHFESGQASQDIMRDGSLVEREINAFALAAERTLGEKTRLELGVAYADTDYRASSLADTSRFSAPMTLYYSIAPRLEVGAGYRFRTTDSLAGHDSRDHFINLALRAGITPKLRGEMRVGLQQRRYFGESSGRDSGLAMHSSLIWQATPRTTLSTSLSRDYATDERGLPVEDTSVGVAVKYAVSPVLFGNINLGYTRADYLQEEKGDDFFNAGVSVTYAPADYIRLSVGYVYNDSEITRETRKSGSSIINISAALRY